jgi:hypothetical protein
LLAQLESSTGFLRVYGFDGAGDNALGATSRPTLYRPATLGLWNGFHVTAPTRVSGSDPSNASFVASFWTPPSIPTLAPSSVKVPLEISFRVPPEQGFLVLPGTGVCLYANTTGGHTWTAGLIWEEV